MDEFTNKLRESRCPKEDACCGVRTHKTRYSVQIETDNKEQFEFMEKMARECIDGKHKTVSTKVKKSTYPRCYKCVNQRFCTQTRDFEHKCPDYVKYAPDGGFYG